MPAIELQQPVDLPATLVGPALQRVLQTIEQSAASDRCFALGVNLDELHLPDAGTVSVPIDLRFGLARGEHANYLTFEFAALSHSELFPTFEGTLRTDPMGPSQCVVWFAGSYLPPLGALGRALDATVMRGIAKRTLTAFLSRVTAEAAAAINAHERAAIRGAESF